MINMSELKEKIIIQAEEQMSVDIIKAADLYCQVLPDERAKLGLAVICFSSERYQEALNHIIDLNSKEALAAKVSIYTQLGNDKEAFEVMKTLYDVSDGENWEMYGDTLVVKEKYKDAVEVFLCAKTLISHLKLAHVYVALSELDLARKLLKEIIKAEPNFYTAHLELASLSTVQEDNLKNSISELHRLYESPAINEEICSAIAQSLGKLYEQENKIDDSFKWYKTHAEYEDKKHNHSTEKNIASVEQVREHYKNIKIDEISKPKNESPLVFVFGMPRSGTTLIEQTLIAHPDISTAGETENIANTIVELSNNTTLESPEEAEKYYINEVLKHKENTRFIVDKMPGNFRFLGLIYQLFPNAKFIFSKRDSVDNCFGCYTTPFSTGHAYSYNFKELAKVYNEHLDFMALWEDVLPPGTIHTVNYEDMVANHQATSTKMLKHIGVDWTDKCSKFHEIKRNVKTASLAQVVKPLYTTSLGRADKYSKHLNELREELSNESSPG